MIDTEKNRYIMEQDQLLSGEQVAQKRFNFGTLYLGLLCIILGIIYFYTSNNASSLKIMVSYSQLWPLLIVSLGLTIFSAKTSKTISIGIFTSILAVGLTIGVVLTPDTQLAGVQNQLSSNLVESTTQAQVTIENTAGDLIVQGGIQDSLLESYYESNYADLQRLDQVDGDSQLVTLSQPEYWEGVGNYYKNLTTRLNTNTPFDLIVKGNAMDVSMDLSDVLINNLDISTTGSDMTITLGNTRPTMAVNLDITASSATIIVPKDVGLEVVSSLNLSTSNFSSLVPTIDGGSYRSADYAQQENKARITLSGVVSRVSVVQQ